MKYFRKLLGLYNKALQLEVGFIEKKERRWAFMCHCCKCNYEHFPFLQLENSHELQETQTLYMTGTSTNPKTNVKPFCLVQTKTKEDTNTNTSKNF